MSDGTSDAAGPSRIVGILGGMGPAATVDFYDKLIRTTPAARDEEHLRVVIWADPTVPNRHAAINGTGEDPTPWLEHGIATLIDAGAELIVSPCNTVHAFLPAVLDSKDVEFLSIIDATVDEIVAGDGGQRIGLLAADGALASGLYQKALHDVGKQPVLLADASQRELMGTIYRLKSGPPEQRDRDALDAALDELAHGGATSAIVGCTELSILVDGVTTDLQLVDASQALARRTVRAARRPT